MMKSRAFIFPVLSVPFLGRACLSRRLRFQAQGRIQKFRERRV